MYGYDSEYVVGMIVYMRRVQCCGVAIGHTKQNAPDSHPNSEVKLLQARVVLGWGTTREGRVLIAFLHFCALFWPPSAPYTQTTTSPVYGRGVDIVATMLWVLMAIDRACYGRGR